MRKVSQRLVAAVSAAVVAAAAGSALAQPDLYISEYKFNDPKMSAVRIDGTNPRTLFPIAPAHWLPIGLTYLPSTGRLVWLDAAGSVKLLSANTNGSAPATIFTMAGFGRGASVDSLGRIFFVVGTTLYRVNADGTGLLALFTGSRENTMGCPRVDATNNHVYVGTDGKIFRMNLDGSQRKEIVRGGSTIRAVGLDVANGNIYWLDTDTITDFVGRAKLDGTGFTILIDNSPNTTGSSGYIDMLVEPQHNALFVADDFRNDVRRYPMTGGSFTTVFSSVADRSPSGLVLSTGEPTPPLLDCNGNGVSDTVEIANGAADCDNNGFLDACQAEPCKPRVLLFDTGSNAEESQGRAVGAPSSWQVFQAFDVPAGGWQISEIGTDGFMSSFADQSGLRIRVYRDNGTGIRPDESVVLGETALSLLFTTYDVNWRYGEMEIDLPQGRYWARIEAVKPGIVGASVNHGFTGQPSLSRGSSGSFIDASVSAALRVVARNVCDADFDGSGFVDTDDFDAFVSAFEAGDQEADFDGSGFVDTDDFDAFVRAFEAGC
ncbi:MAG: hypothetical protein L6Q35_09390 [Phycisphaerales bacterium]|nr:hypothetical protein [Phycisphaerales bacterium]